MARFGYCHPTHFVSSSLMRKYSTFNRAFLLGNAPFFCHFPETRMDGFHVVSSINECTKRTARVKELLNMLKALVHLLMAPR